MRPTRVNVKTCLTSARRNPSAESTPGLGGHQHRFDPRQPGQLRAVNRPCPTEGHEGQFTRVNAALHADDAERAEHPLIHDADDAERRRLNR